LHLIAVLSQGYFKILGSNIYITRITKAQDQITVKDIEQFFPLKGQYVFRFKHEYEKKKFVWMDLPSSAKRLPSYEDKIFIKATRINWENVKDSSDRVQ
jgi:hypothetical protein